MLDVMPTITVLLCVLNVTFSLIEAVDKAFRDVCKVDDALLEEVHFGGKVVVFGGVFRQVLPVVQKGSRDNIIGQCINRSFF